MSKIQLGVVMVALSLVLVGCAFGAAPTPEVIERTIEGRTTVESESMPEAPGSDQAFDAEPNVQATERLIIRNARLQIVVPDTEEATEAVNDLVEELGGYVVQSNVYQYEEGVQASMQVRVPAERLDEALDRVRDLASDVRSESITGEDVTEEYVDLDSRLRYLERTEERLLTFLDEAEDTEAALAVYEDLRQIQSEIEQVTGRMQYLEQSAAMATINLDITPDALAQPIQVGGWHPEGTLRDAFESLVRVLQFLVDALIVILVLVLPTLIVIALPLAAIILLVRLIVRRRRARKSESE